MDELEKAKERAAEGKARRKAARERVVEETSNAGRGKSSHVRGRIRVKIN